jgi:hypothetical protein
MGMMGRLRWVWVLALFAVGCRGPIATPAPAAEASPTPVPLVSTPTPPPAALTSPPPATATLPPTRTPQSTASPTATAASQASPTDEAAAENGGAVDVVLAYLAARAEADVAGVSDLSCAAWRGQATTEAISFRGMQAEMVDVACRLAGSDGPWTLVSCSGKIVTTYGTESRDWDLDSFVYQTSVEDGQWKMCGYHSG